MQECVHLLTMPTRVARTLSACLNDPQSRHKEDALHEAGVSMLTLAQARAVLAKRTDLMSASEIEQLADWETARSAAKAEWR
jgi:hypothetical protein